jgi:hypothetical protein
MNIRRVWGYQRGKLRSGAGTAYPSGAPKTSHRKLKIEQHEPHKNHGGELVCSGRMSSSSPLVALVVLLLLKQTYVITILRRVWWLVVHVFVPCLLAIVLCVLHWFKAPDYPFIKYLQIFLEYYDIMESKLMECKILGTLFLALVTIVFGYVLFSDSRCTRYNSIW